MASVDDNVITATKHDLSQHEAQEVREVRESREAEAAALASIARFQRWLSVLCRNNLATLDKERSIIHVESAVARCFSLGFAGESALLGMMRDEMAWAGSMPWSHAAIHRGRNTLHAIARQMPYADGLMCPFALSFEFPREKIAQMEDVTLLEIREVLGRGDEGTAMLSRTAVRAMPFFVLDRKDDVLNANDAFQRDARARIGKR